MKAKLSFARTVLAMPVDGKDMYGLLWVRDKEIETFELTLEKGYDFYKNKYGDEPLLIECSEKDRQDIFQYKTAQVVPTKHYNKGIIWITGKYFENKQKSGMM